MPSEITLLSAFLTGFFGSVHCIGMCGGIVGALTAGLPKGSGRTLGVMLPYQLFYNVGRIISYTVAGGVAGFIGTRVLHTASFSQAHLVAMIISGAFMIALGLYISGWWRGLVILERLGSKVWQYIEPVGKAFVPVTHLWQALLLGLVWGWLPCGMVYAILVWSLSAGSATDGALLMLAFGLGTLPTLLALGEFARKLESFRSKHIVRNIAGIIIICFGVFLLISSGGSNGSSDNSGDGAGNDHQMMHHNH